MAAAAAVAGAHETDSPAWAPSPKQVKRAMLPFFNFSRQPKFDREPIRSVPPRRTGSASEPPSRRSSSSLKSPRLNVRIEELLERVSSQVERCDQHCVEGLEDLRRSCDELFQRLGAIAGPPGRPGVWPGMGSSAALGSSASLLSGGGQRSPHLAYSPGSPHDPAKGREADRDRDAGEKGRRVYNVSEALVRQDAKVANLSALTRMRSNLGMGVFSEGEDGPFDPNCGEAQPAVVRIYEPRMIADAAEVAETAPLIPKGPFCVCWEDDYGRPGTPGGDRGHRSSGMLRSTFIEKDVRRGWAIEVVTNFLEEPESSSSARAFNRIMPPFVVATVVVTLSQSMQPPLLEGRPAALIETCIDIFFTTELFLRVAFAPSLRRAFLSTYNLLDLLASLPLVFRAYYGLDPPMEEGCLTRNVLLCAVPVLRTMKVLRRFGQFQLLLKAFTQVFEALPVLLYTLAVFVLVFSSLIYVVEPRDNITCLPEAVWLAIVTMSTVGYGDITPVSTLGTVIVSTLVILSALYMAMPLGIIGYTFTQIWKDRDRILLMLRTQERLEQWGYSAEDILLLFQLFDTNEDGQLDLEEFSMMLKKLRIGLQEDRIVDLFTFIDKDCGGTIDDLEFVRAIFPADFHAIYGARRGDDEDDVFRKVSTEQGDNGLGDARPSTRPSSVPVRPSGRSVRSPRDAT